MPSAVCTVTRKGNCSHPDQHTPHIEILVCHIEQTRQDMLWVVRATLCLVHVVCSGPAHGQRSDRRMSRDRMFGEQSCHCMERVRQCITTRSILCAVCVCVGRDDNTHERIVCFYYCQDMARYFSSQSTKKKKETPPTLLTYFNLHH